MDFTRPKIKLTISPLDRVLDWMAWAALVFVWVYTIYCYGKLPPVIPTHYSLQGGINGYGSRDTVWVAPIILTLLIVGLTVLNKYPHIFNYPATLTLQNAERQYLLATRLIRCIKCIIAALFIFVAYQQLKSTGAKKTVAGSWPVIALIVLLQGITIVYIYKSFKKHSTGY